MVELLQMRRIHFLIALIPVVAMVGCKPQAPKVPEVARYTKLEIIDTKVGTGKPAKEGDTLLMHYKGTMQNGVVFDENKAGAEPYQVVLGSGGVIPGWDKGLIGMKEGGLRTLKVPTSLAYGAEGNGKIPPNADLNFDVELVELIPSDELNTVVVKPIKKGVGLAIKDGDMLTIEFVGKTLAGLELVSSKDSGPIRFKYGAVPSALAARGLEAGMVGMKVGETREIRVPPGMGVTPMPGAGAPPGRPGFQIYTVTLKKIG